MNSATNNNTANKSGIKHWKEQRRTALLLFPLSLWVVFNLFALAGESHQVVTTWIGQTLNGILLIVFIAALFRHMKLGLEMVIDDYIHGQSANKWHHMFISAFCAIAMITGIVSVIIIMSNS